MNYIKELIEDHERTYDEENLRDVMDCYLKQIYENKGNPESRKVS